MLALDEISYLERFSISADLNHVKVIAGHLVFCFMAGARWHDSMYITNVDSPRIVDCASLRPTLTGISRQGARNNRWSCCQSLILVREPLMHFGEKHGAMQDMRKGAIIDIFFDPGQTQDVIGRLENVHRGSFFVVA